MVELGDQGSQEQEHCYGVTAVETVGGSFVNTAVETEYHSEAQSMVEIYPPAVLLLHRLPAGLPTQRHQQGDVLPRQRWEGVPHHNAKGRLAGEADQRREETAASEEQEAAGHFRHV